MTRAVGTFRRWGYPPTSAVPATRLVSRNHRRPLHSTPPPADPSGPGEKVDQAQLERLLERFSDDGMPSGVESTTGEPTATPTRARRKSKIEDYDAWHGWDGESDKGASGDVQGDVDRYISDVLSDVAKSKAERARAAVEGVEGSKEIVDQGSGKGAAAGTVDPIESASSSSSMLNSPPPTKPPTRQPPTFSKTDMSLLAKKLQTRLDEEIQRLKSQKEDVKQSLTLRAREFSRDAQVRFGLLGGKVNEVTGYTEIERLKQQVREREHDMARLREEAALAKDAYDQAVTARSVSQQDLNSLMERKHSWTEADVSRFTNLVRSDQTISHAVTSSKEALKRAESDVDKAFTALLKSILERYHEEQVWSDKIRSVSTYGSLIVLLINLIVFLGAIAVVEPWKRRRLVKGLEERVKGMVDNVEHTVTGEFEQVKNNMASVAAALAQLQADMDDRPTTDRIRRAYVKQELVGEFETAPSGGQATGDTSAPSNSGLAKPTTFHSSLLPSSTLPMINKVSSAAASFLAEQDPHRVDLAIIGTAGLLAGAAVTALITAFR